MSSSREFFVAAQRAMLQRYDVDAHSRFIDVASIKGKAQVLEFGAGPPVVMISGLGTPAAMWAPLMAQLHGLHLHAIDLPGYGLTDTIQGFTDNLRSNAVTFLTSVFDRLELERPAIIANSLGSLWSSWLALDRPERVAALVHVGCPAIVLDTSAPLPMRLLSVPGLRRLMLWLQPPSEKQVIQLSKMVREHPMVPELVELLVATERLPHFQPMFLATLNKLLRLRGSRPELRLTAEQLRTIKIPTLLVFGTNDPMGGPEVGRRMAEFMPNAALKVVDGGHAPWLTQSDEIGQRVSDFLQAKISSV